MRAACSSVMCFRSLLSASSFGQFALDTYKMYCTLCDRIRPLQWVVSFGCLAFDPDRFFCLA